MKKRQPEDPGEDPIDKEVREEAELMKKVVGVAMETSLSLIGKELNSVARDHDACMKKSKNTDEKLACMSNLIWRMDKVHDMRHQAVQATVLGNSLLISNSKNLLGEILSALVGRVDEGIGKKDPETGPGSMYR